MWKNFIEQSVVSIYGPLGYGPSTLPLRHSAVKRDLEIRLSFCPSFTISQLTIVE